MRKVAKTGRIAGICRNFCPPVFLSIRHPLDARLCPRPDPRPFKVPPMSLRPEDIRRLAQLARINLAASDAASTLNQLNNIFSMVEQLQAVDTTGIAPLSHPLATLGEMGLRLREDKVTESDQRDANMANAPQQENGLFLVPRVIE